MIVVGGDCLVDMIQTNVTGRAIQFDGLRGGSSYNTALAAARQGNPVGFLTPLSTDNMGDFLVEEMVNSNVAMLADRVDAPTSLALVTLTNGQPSYQFYRNGVADRSVTLPQLRANFPSDTRVLHVSSLGIADGDDADAWADFIVSLDDSAVLTTLDPNIRPLLIPDRTGFMGRLWKILSAIDVVKLSDEDLEWIFPDMDQDAALEALIQRSNAALTVLTLGEDGAIARWGGHTMRIPVAKADPFVDAVGAGDTFMATLVSQLYQAKLFSNPQIAALDEDAVRNLLTQAAKAAALNCQQKGCNPPWAEELN